MIQKIETIEGKMTRDKAERLGPLIKHEAVPVFRNQYEAEAYRERELLRMLNGYNGCTGDHYEYVQHWKIKDGYGATIKPNWRDTDSLVIFPTLQECDTNKLDDFTLKRREIGFSSIAGFRANKYAQRYPGSVINITSYSEDAMVKLMKQKIKFMGEHCFEDIEEQWVKVMGTKKSCFKPKVQWHESSTSLRYIDPDMGSIIQGVQTTRSETSAKNMEGDRIMFAFIDEFFLHKFATKVRASADASRKMGLANIGRISLGGSAGGATEDGAARAMDLWNNHDMMGIKILFIPGYMSIDIAQELDSHGRPIQGSFVSFTKNGWSLAEEAKEWIHKTRKVLYSLADKTDYWQFVKAYPLDVEEIFETTGDGSWGADERKRFEAQKKYISLNPQNCMKPVVLQDSGVGGIVVKNVSDSSEWMLEPPIEGEEYIAGIDPIPIVTRKESDGRSDYSLVIKRRSTQQYVYRYTERSKDSSRLAGKTIRALKFYNNAKVMIERNRGDVIILEFERSGNRILLANEPPPFRPKGSKIIEPGYVKHVHNADFLASNLQTWARFYDEKQKIGGIEGVLDRLMLDQVYTFNEGNKDIADAIQACELLDWWLREYQKRKNEWNEKRGASSTKMIPYYMQINGSRKLVLMSSSQLVAGEPISLPNKKNRR